MTVDPEAPTGSSRFYADGLSVQVLDSAWEHRYQEFVASHPQTLLYYSLRFRDLLIDLLGCRARYAVATSGPEVIGALPLMVSAGPYGQVLNSLPYYGSNGGILARDSTASAALSAWYDLQVADADVASATIISNPLHGDTAAPRGHDLHDERVSLITPLEGFDEGRDAILAMIDSSARRNVNKALRSGVQVAIDCDYLPALETLHRDNMDRIGGQAKSTSFFEGVRRHFRAGKDYDLYVAFVDGEVAAALLIFYFGTTVEYYVPAIGHAYRSLQPLAALLHRAMADAGGHGFRRWNWGGSWLSQESLIRFKRKWGGQQRTYSYWTSVRRHDLLSASPAALLDAYPHFYVVPFTSLVTAGEKGTP